MANLRQGRIILGDFNAHVGKGLDIVGHFREDACNHSKLVELMQQLDLVLWNCREFCVEPHGLELY